MGSASWLRHFFLFLMAWPVLAQAQWDHVEENDYTLAATINSDGFGLGQRCDLHAGTCKWVLATATKCALGAKHPALMNGADSVASVTINCEGLARSSGDLYRYSIGPFDDVDSLVRASSLVGVAVALESGRFLVLRFNTAGANSELDKMRETALRKTTSSTKSSTL